MTRIKTTCLTIVAMFAMSGVTAATASAELPELVKEGKSGVELVKKNITTESSEPSKLENTREETVTCSAEKGKSVAEGVKNVKEAKVTFTGCVASIGGKCTSSGQAEGTIVTNTMKGRIDYISKSSKVVGLLLQPESGTEFAKFVCAGFLTNYVVGSVIGEFGPVNALTTSFSLTYAKGSSPGLQKFTKFEGESTEHYLESTLFGSTTKANEQAKAKAKTEETAELLA